MRRWLPATWRTRTARSHCVTQPSAPTPYSRTTQSLPPCCWSTASTLPLPEVDEQSYELQISGVGIKETTLTLDDIKKFPKYTLTACIQCAGNRRGEMSTVKPVKGLDWGSAAIGNAQWSGARLYDVLTSLGLKEDDPKVKHIKFKGMDTDVINVPYGASIPVEKGMNPRGDVLLAYEMNGEPLTIDHGFPLRVIVPGTVGARNVKWLSSIKVSGCESPAHWQQYDYKGFSPSVDWDTVDWSSAPAIQELPVISAICDPVNGASVKPNQGKVKLRGYAFSGGGHQVVRVDVTADKGHTWHTATLEQESARPPRHWGWTLWTVDVPVSPKASRVEFWVKAVDNSYNTQPETINNIWNLRGILNNAYHRIKVNITK
uniref:Sulfite oxidase n=1 Tax=Graphocephala atropunctata TaxID=36148 RepID=A0A1B6LRG4_9HEMI